MREGLLQRSRIARVTVASVSRIIGGLLSLLCQLVVVGAAGLTRSSSACRRRMTGRFRDDRKSSSGQEAFNTPSAVAAWVAASVAMAWSDAPDLMSSMHARHSDSGFLAESK